MIDIMSFYYYYILISLWMYVSCLPIEKNDMFVTNDLIGISNSSEDNINQDLYLIKAMIYEVGILTEQDENKTSPDSQERVDITFYDAHTNNSHIDLGTIPLPIETNISGEILTGIAPVVIGAVSSPMELIEVLPLSNKLINITNSNDTAMYEMTRSKSNENISDMMTNQQLWNQQQANLNYTKQFSIEDIHET